MYRYCTLIILVIFMACSSTKDKTDDSQKITPSPPSVETSSKYMRWVGDSKFNPELDDPNFELCYGDSQVRQYFNFSKGMRYQGEKQALVNHFTDKYQTVKSKQSGLIRIRFIVNCKGETGRFRLIGSNENYQKQEFAQDITKQLLAITKSLDGWQKQPDDNSPKDYYQYLVFKIRDGALIEIMP